jgi:hypothetical protein
MPLNFDSKIKAWDGTPEFGSSHKWWAPHFQSAICLLVRSTTFLEQHLCIHQIAAASVSARAASQCFAIHIDSNDQIGRGLRQP